MLKRRPEVQELFRTEKRVWVRDGDRPGLYVMPVYHSTTCPRASGSDDCNCDAMIGRLDFIHGPEGAN